MRFTHDIKESQRPVQQIVTWTRPQIDDSLRLPMLSLHAYLGETEWLYSLTMIHASKDARWSQLHVFYFEAHHIFHSIHSLSWLLSFCCSMSVFALPVSSCSLISYSPVAGLKNYCHYMYSWWGEHGTEFFFNCIVMIYDQFPFLHLTRRNFLQMALFSDVVSRPWL